MSAIAVDSSTWPLVRIVYPPSFDDAEYRTLIARLNELLDRKQPFVMLQDTRVGGTPNAVQRKLTTDSRLTFTAPADGSYLVRVTDTRGFGGDRSAYRLVVREAKPDFGVALEGVASKIPAGTGRSFGVRADRADGFEGPISVELWGFPAGYKVATPLVYFLSMTVRARRTSWRITRITGGAITRLTSDIQGSVMNIIIARPTRVRKSRPNARISRLSVWLAAAAPVVRRGMNSEEGRDAK